MINLNGTKFYLQPSEDTIEWIENLLCEQTTTGTLTREIDGDITITLGDEDYGTHDSLCQMFYRAEADSTYVF